MKPDFKPYWYTDRNKQFGIRLQYRRGRWFDGNDGMKHWNQSFVAIEIGRFGLFRSGGSRAPEPNIVI